MGGPQGRSGPVRKISLPPGFDPQIVQPVARRYTDYAMPAPLYLTDIYLGLYMFCGPVKGRFWIVILFRFVGSEDMPYLGVRIM